MGLPDSGGGASHSKGVVMLLRHTVPLDASVLVANLGREGLDVCIYFIRCCLVLTRSGEQAA